MCYAGFKALAKRLCVGHAYSWPARWGCEVEVFGRCVRPGQLIHADKHGFLAIPEEDEAALLAAARFMDTNECRTLLSTARESAGLPLDEVVARLEAARVKFGENTKLKFKRRGEF
jgi:4-hydroxy-4-methyl-2-oxoglutarate aldolase